MQRFECEFEAEVLAAVVESRWPGAAGASLREHVAGCAICSDVAAVAGAIDTARRESRSTATVPDSGHVWWRAQLRARREAAEAAGRPITAAQLIAFACAVGLLGACFGATSTWFQTALKWMASSLADLDVKAFVPSAAALLAEHAVLAIGIAGVLFLVPAAVYFVVVRD
jgi:hypothetical protein